MSRLLAILLLFVVFTVNSQTTLEVFDRKTYLDIRCELSDIPMLVKKYSTSVLPLHLDISPDTNLKQEHFTQLSKLPLTFLRFSMWEKNYYCSGLNLLQSLDSLELSGHAHPFLSDASKLKELKYLQLEIFIPDSSIHERCSFDQITKMRISLSFIDDLSKLFNSLKGLQFLDFTKNDAKIKLASTMQVLKVAPIQKLCFALCSIDTTDFKTAVFPYIKKVWLISVHTGETEFGFHDFILQNPTLEFVDITMNGLTEKFAADLREKFPDVKIKRDY